ncbi:MAG TPA: glycosyltransferase [Candidatus Paceibacterota bacterium]|nr:glycosyltransferase [Candidatus Paceibacterota bacterium]
MFTDIIITSYNEPNSTLRTVNNFLEQIKKIKKENPKSKDKFRITVVDPFPEVEKFLKKQIKDKEFVFFLDPGEGKSYALNLLFQEYASSSNEDIIISTDGDVYTSSNSLFEIINAFKEKEIGCITARPVAIDNRNTKYGYWAHVVFAGIDKTRKKLSEKKSFFECSGYLFAIRKNVILDFPMETSEDSIIPYLFWKKGYKIKYLPQIEVYVKNPDNWKDWLAQKVRNIKAHENLSKIAPDMPRTKSFFNEIKEGAFFAPTQIRSVKQVWWTIELYFARLYLYIKAFKELKKKSSYTDGWRGEATIDSTKTLD